MILLLTGMLSGCLPRPRLPQALAWSYSDVRALDPAEEGLDPRLDLLAAYVRRSGRDVQVRLDLLDSGEQPAADLYLAFDLAQGGTTALPIDAQAGQAWDLLLVIPAGGPQRILRPGVDGQAEEVPSPAGLGVLALRDPTLDLVEISLNRNIFGEGPLGFNLEVFSTPAGSGAVADRMLPFNSNGLPPSQANALLAFSETMPGYTPALALRRWDGAHTGPLGGRHGLYNLLRTARAAQAPLVLLDVLDPAAISALSYLNGLGLVRSGAEDRLLVLAAPLPPAPFALPQQAYARWRGWQAELSRKFRVTAGPAVYAPGGLAEAEKAGMQGQVIFVPAGTSDAGKLEPVALQKWRARLVIPVPAEAGQAPTEQATPDGPTLEVRRALAQAAASDGEGKTPLLVLGGSLPLSAWGSPQAARATLHYLNAHPWVRLWGPDELLAAAASQPADAPPALPQPPASLGALLTRLEGAPQNLAAEAAWQAFWALFAPVSPAPAGLSELRQAYQGQTHLLLSAAEWAAKPTERADCASDPDGDGQPECILSGTDFFAVIEPQDGSLALAFAQRADGLHQISASSAQLISGLSDPSSWNLSRGPGADPAVIPAAFAGPGQEYQAQAHGQNVVLTSRDGRESKAFRLVPGGLQVEYRLERPAQVQIPLVLDPWTRFKSGWIGEYTSQALADGWAWGLEGSVQVEVSGAPSAQQASFLDSLPFLDAPEDPNRDYPSGHYLPFPAARLEIAAQGSFTVEIRVVGPASE